MDPGSKLESAPISTTGGSLSSADSPCTKVRCWPGFHIHKKELKKCLLHLLNLDPFASLDLLSLTRTASAGPTTALYFIENASMGEIFKTSGLINVKDANAAQLLMVFCVTGIPLPHTDEVFDSFCILPFLFWKWLNNTNNMSDKHTHYDDLYSSGALKATFLLFGGLRNLRDDVYSVTDSPVILFVVVVFMKSLGLYLCLCKLLPSYLLDCCRAL